MIKTTKNISEANLVTHGGKFHADEVMATVILSKVVEDPIVCRSRDLVGEWRKDVIIYDIGEGRFDHHQKGGNGCRPNGVPYASAGLVWRRFGPRIVDNHSAWKIVDRMLIQGIDAIDNGTTIKSDYITQVMNIYHCINYFNPTWENTEDADEAFLKAVAFAETVFDNTLKHAIAKVKAKEIVEEAIEKSKDGIMILGAKVPWQEHIFTSQNVKAKDILFVVYPSNRGGYIWRVVPEELGTFSKRKFIPKEWRGLDQEALREVTGVKTALFCHAGGFMGRTETLEDAIAMAKLAIEA